jgi:hypothetical protein
VVDNVEQAKQAKVAEFSSRSGCGSHHNGGKV